MIATGMLLLVEPPPTTAPALPRGWQSGLLIPGLWLVGALLLAALVIAVLNRWRRDPGGAQLTASEQLAQFRSLYEKGEMSREEFERIRTLLGGQLRGTPTTTTTPPAHTPETAAGDAAPPVPGLNGDHPGPAPS